MPDSLLLFAPAKINLFLHVLNKRNDGFHNIKSGITFINLFDEISIKKDIKTSIKYFGRFAPAQGYFKDCIIKKTLNFLNLEKNINIKVSIKKNIPVQAGLGSASSNVATFLLGLEKLDLIKIKKNYKIYSSLGADIPAFLYGKNLLVEGIGEKISKYFFPKYFFLLVKPTINLSTKEMYKKIITTDVTLSQKNKNIDKNENRNDFEKIAIQESEEISDILGFLSNSEKKIFSQLTGSGSSCFACYEKLEYAINAQNKLKNCFPKLWSIVCRNNIDKK